MKHILILFLALAGLVHSETVMVNSNGTNRWPEGHKAAFLAAVGAVARTTTVNGHALSSNVVIAKEDIGMGDYPTDPAFLGALGYVVVKAPPFNAVGNGTTDDTAAIQAAMDTGKSVFFPKGRYKITSKIDWDHLGTYDTTSIPLMNGQRIMGEGPSKTVIYQSNPSAHIFDISQTAGFYGQIRDMAFEGTGGNTHTGYGLASSGGGPHNWWRIDNCYFYWLGKGISAALEDSEISNCVFDSNTVGIDLELANNGAAINCNKIRNCSFIYQAGSKYPTNPGIGIRINGGQGHEIDGLDLGNVGMVTGIELNGTSSGIINNFSAEMYPYSGQTVSCINGVNAGTSRWSINNANFVGFGAMAAGDYPIIQGRFVSMPTNNIWKSGNWQAGMMKRTASNEIRQTAVNTNQGVPYRSDIYNGSTLIASANSSPFNEVGSQATLTPGATNVGEIHTKTNVAGQADAIWRYSKDASDNYFVADLMAFPLLTRGATGIPYYSSGTGSILSTTGTGNVLLGDQAVSTTSNPTFPSINGATTLELRTGTTPRITIASNGNVTVNGTASFTTGGNISTTSGNMIVPNLFYFLVSGRGGFTMAADGVMTVINNAGSSFSRLQLGGTTSSFPAIKRNGTAINFRLADDSADAGITAGTASFSGRIAAGAQVQLKGYTVATLPGSPAEGDTAYVTDATAPTYLGTLTGGGSVKCPVFYNGTAWVSH